MTAERRHPSLARRMRSHFARALREPLVQFLAIALVLFGANQLINGSESSGPAELITVSKGRVSQIADSYRLLVGRSPSPAELQALVTDFADEEIAYREAVALGLDAEDTIVRRRMRQKLEFLAEESEASEEPTDAELATWLREHAPRYQLPARISFRQVMASSDTQGTRARRTSSSDPSNELPRIPVMRSSMYRGVVKDPSFIPRGSRSCELQPGADAQLPGRDRPACEESGARDSP